MNLLRLYRVKGWCKNLGITLIGFLINSGIKIELLTPLLVASLAQAYAFSINDFYDFQETEEQNFLGNLIKEGKFSKRKGLFFCLLPGIISLVLSAFLGLWVLLTNLLFISLYTFYSRPLARLKKDWKFSLPINTICLGVLLFLLGYFTGGIRLKAYGIVFLLIFASYILLSELIHQISHKREDKRAGIKSFPIEFGNELTLKVGKLTQLVPIIFSLYMILLDPFKKFFFLGVIIFSLLRILKLFKVKGKDESFKELRNSLYGISEGIYLLFVAFIL